MLSYDFLLCDMSNKQRTSNRQKSMAQKYEMREY